MLFTQNSLQPSHKSVCQLHTPICSSHAFLFHIHISVLHSLHLSHNTCMHTHMHTHTRMHTHTHTHAECGKVAVFTSTFHPWGVVPFSNILNCLRTVSTSFFLSLSPFFSDANKLFFFLSALFNLHKHKSGGGGGGVDRDIIAKSDPRHASCLSVFPSVCVCVWGGGG